jgi:putative restriction endonuclease
MFDRGLVSVDDDLSILIAENRLPDTALQLINEDRRLILPPREDLRPHRQYIRYHQQRIFKG